MHASISKKGSIGSGPKCHFPGFGWSVQDPSYLGKHGAGGLVMESLVLGGAPHNNLVQQIPACTLFKMGREDRNLKTHEACIL